MSVYRTIGPLVLFFNYLISLLFFIILWNYRDGHRVGAQCFTNIISSLNLHFGSIYGWKETSEYKYPLSVNSKR